MSENREQKRKDLGAILGDGFILVFNQDKLDAVRTVEALKEAGLRQMEMTMRVREPLGKMEAILKEFPDFLLGAASLVDSPAYGKVIPTIQQAYDAGARYLVSPAPFKDETYRRFGPKVLMVPGTATPEEHIRSWEQGANIVKVFPALELGGPAYIRAVDAALHKVIPLCPMGGTNRENIPEYINSGVVAVGGSFAILSRDEMARLIETGHFVILRNRLREYIELVGAARRDLAPVYASGDVEKIAAATGRGFNL